MQRAERVMKTSGIKEGHKHVEELELMKNAKTELGRAGTEVYHMKLFEWKCYRAFNGVWLMPQDRYVSYCNIKPCRSWPGVTYCEVTGYVSN